MKTLVLTTTFALLLACAVWFGGGLFLANSAVPGDAEPDRPAPRDTQAGGPPVRLALAAAFVSEQGTGVYARISDYLAKRTGRRHEFVTGLSYATINSMLADGKVELAFVCGLPYVLDQERPQPTTELLASPVMRAARYGGKPKYFSDLIVRADSPHNSLQDLRGRTFVYNDELSNSGYNMPRFRLVGLGEKGDYFGKVLRSGSHEESIRMVATGQADASFVDSLVLDFDRAKGLGFAGRVRVIESVGPAGICPVVVSRKAPPGLKERWMEIFLAMHADAEGREILDEALVERFVVPEDSNYDDIRRMKRAAEAAGFLVIR